MTSILSNLKPTLLWKHFDEIRKIPHGSGNEKALAEYVKSVAKKNNCPFEQDEVGNVLVRKPRTSRSEKADTVIIQGHLDMVCEKNSDVKFDFTKDAIQVDIDGDWVVAKGTTLGADNGIGLAASLALIEDDSLTHGPLELLFTVDEETRLTGASAIKPGFLKGKKLINTDSEREGEFCIGCSGGGDSEIFLPITRTLPLTGQWLRIKLSGLKGGHSGLEIHLGRGNAIKMLARMLWQTGREYDFALVSFTGGNKRNAIPREAFAEVVVAKAKLEDFKARLQKAYEELQFEFKAVEKDMKLELEALSGAHPQTLDAGSQKTLLNFLLALPHGVLAMSQEISGLVETSTNLATINCGETSVEIVEASRSSVASALTATRDRLCALAELVGAEINQPAGYPGWTPNLDSFLLTVAKETYTRLFGKEPGVAAIHAGLECGIIGEKFPGMDMISIGPQLENPHSPSERVHIGSVERFWQLLVAILEALG